MVERFEEGYNYKRGLMVEWFEEGYNIICSQMSKLSTSQGRTSKAGRVNSINIYS